MPARGLSATVSRLALWAFGWYRFHVHGAPGFKARQCDDTSLDAASVATARQCLDRRIGYPSRRDSVSLRDRCGRPARARERVKTTIKGHALGPPCRKRGASKVRCLLVFQRAEGQGNRDLDTLQSPHIVVYIRRDHPSRVTLREGPYQKETI